MKLGVVSDTHGYFDPRLLELLAGADAILHAGDVGSGEVLTELGQIAKVCAVSGNVDPPELDLPPSSTLQFEGIQVEILHQLAVPQEELKAWADGALLPRRFPDRREAFLNGFDEATRVVVFGHSHQPCLLALGNRLFFNPGSAGLQRFSFPRCAGILDIFPRGVQGAILELEEYNGTLPAKLWLPLED